MLATAAIRDTELDESFLCSFDISKEALTRIDS